MTVRSVGTLTSSGTRRSMRWYQGAAIAWPCCLHPVALMIGCWSVVLSSIDITVKAQSSEYRIPIPYYRFTLWRDLDRATTQARALELAYNERSWNAPGTNAIEEQAYGSIEAESTTRITAVRAIGFDEDTWDCWVNHYGDYEWDELVEEEVDQYFRALGWTQSLWDGGGSAVTDELDWEDLTTAERAAALALCYTSDLWDGLELTQWSVLPTRPSTPQPTPRPLSIPSSVPTNTPTALPTESWAPDSTRRPTGSPSTTAPTLEPKVTQPPMAEPNPESPSSTRIPPDVSPIRYVVFANLTTEMRDHASTLSYTQRTWDLPGSAPVEKLAFSRLRGEFPTGAITVEAMGLTREQWDCYINHYEDYSWILLERYELQVYFRQLGWTEESWEGDLAAPKTDDKWWRELSTEEREAAIQLCFRQETWDGIPLTAWSGGCSFSVTLTLCLGIIGLSFVW